MDAFLDISMLFSENIDAEKKFTGQKEGRLVKVDVGNGIHLRLSFRFHLCFLVIKSKENILLI